MELLLNEYEDVLIQHVLCYLTLNELNLFSQINRHSHTMIMLNDNQNSYLFQQLYFNEQRIINTNKQQQLIEQVQQSNMSWMQFYREYALIHFDSSFTTPKFLLFENQNRTVTSKEPKGYETWDSVSCNFKMVPGRKYKWKFIVEKYERSGNTYELVMGCVDRRAVDVADNYSFNSDSLLVSFRNYNHGIGFNVGQWSNRIGEQHELDNIFIPQMTELENKVPFTVSFLLDFKSTSFAELTMYCNDELLSIIRKENPPSEYYPTVSSCTDKTISVRPW
jgi:hypothetical protein